MNIPSFVQSAQEALDVVKLLLSRCKDILDCRINQNLEEIKTVCLCELPADEQWSIEELVSRTTVR